MTPPRARQLQRFVRRHLSWGAPCSGASPPRARASSAQPTAARGPAVTWGRSSGPDTCARASTSSTHHYSISASRYSFPAARPSNANDAAMPVISDSDYAAFRRERQRRVAVLSAGEPAANARCRDAAMGWQRPLVHASRRIASAPRTRRPHVPTSCTTARSASRIAFR